eukprot:TRINITY_DN2827_c0_g1_i4.p1 TRINITY_DN2827_c0_g1~~TRINITY_DN2827_c0_g1_i4.p1  ORF type:complete len:381 (+),score=59.83 TRINITY_DN2827_c0_g1_i4:139-1281(+)
MRPAGNGNRSGGKNQRSGNRIGGNRRGGKFGGGGHGGRMNTAVPGQYTLGDSWNAQSSYGAGDPSIQKTTSNYSLNNNYAREPSPGKFQQATGGISDNYGTSNLNQENSVPGLARESKQISKENYSRPSNSGYAPQGGYGGQQYNSSYGQYNYGTGTKTTPVMSSSYDAPKRSPMNPPKAAALPNLTMLGNQPTNNQYEVLHHLSSGGNQDLKQKNNSSFYKTRMCPHFPYGRCVKADACNFAHSEAELREAPNLRKTKMCLLFIQGTCQNGTACTYAHTKDELRATPEYYKTSLCNSYLNGRCRLGDKCRFAHGDQDLRARGPGQSGDPYQRQQGYGDEDSAGYAKYQNDAGGPSNYQLYSGTGQAAPGSFYANQRYGN